MISQERAQIISKLMENALATYQEENAGALPGIIFMYRDGVGGPTMLEKVLKYEVQQVIESLHSYSSGYKPSVVYTLVDKNTILRLFEKDNGECMNPAPGTCVDTGLVMN